MSARINTPKMANTNRLFLSATELAAEADGNEALAEWARLGRIFIENWEPDDPDDDFDALGDDPFGNNGRTRS